MAAFLPALAFGGKLLLGGATVGGTALGAASIYDAASGAGKGFRDKAYAAGPDQDGNFSAGFIGNQFIDEDSEAFKAGYKDYALRNNSTLQQMQGLLGDKFKFDPKKTLSQNITSNSNQYQRALEEQKIEFEKLTTAYQRTEEDRAEEKRRFQASERRAEQARLDDLKSQRDNLQFQMLQAQRENDRYYDRLEREDKKDRREGYNQLGLGLAALASAFTIV